MNPSKTPEETPSSQPLWVGVSPPTEDPCEAYKDAIPPSINCGLFQLSPKGLGDPQRQEALQQLKAYQSKQQQNFLGYQTNQKLDYAEDLSSFLNILCNNLGDPFSKGNDTVNTKWIERAVLDYFAALWNANWPHKSTDSVDEQSGAVESEGDAVQQGQKSPYWGYVLTMGSSEGNLYGMWNARDYLSGKFLMVDKPSSESLEFKAQADSQNEQSRSIAKRLTYQQGESLHPSPNAYTPVAFYSEDTHYSIIKAMRVLEIKTFYDLGSLHYPHENPLGGDWPREVPSTGGSGGPGSIDIDALVKLVEFFAMKGHPILICFNYGTAFKGAYDDVKAAGTALKPIFQKYGLWNRKIHYDPDDLSKVDQRTGFWFHVDGALGAAYMPFIEMAQQAGRIDSPVPPVPIFDFRLPFVHSIGMSGHKWIGSPWPCGIYMTKTKFQLLPPDEPAYIGSPDTTFAGSRNGFSSLILWNYLAKHSYEDQIKRALETEKMATYAHGKLDQLQRKLKQDLWIARTPLALTVRFRCPSPDLVFKYSLSTEAMYVGAEKRLYCHIFTMTHVTELLIDQFIADLEQLNAFPDLEQPPRLGTYFASDSPAPDSFQVERPGRGFQ